MSMVNKVGGAGIKNILPLAIRHKKKRGDIQTGYRLVIMIDMGYIVLFYASIFIITFFQVYIRITGEQ